MHNGVNNVFLVRNDGKVGIGTAIPRSSLHVAGGDVVADRDVIVNRSLVAMNMYVGDKWMVVTNGNVGIGMASPSETLSVVGRVYVEGPVTGIGGSARPTLTVTGAGDHFSSGRLVDLNAPWVAFHVDRYFVTGRDGNGTPRFYIRGDGEFLKVSSQHLKSDITPIAGALDRLKRMEGVFFHWKEAPDSARQVGFIAEDLARIMPEAVNETKTHVNSSAVIPVLVEGLKEMHARHCESVGKYSAALAAKDREIQVLTDRLSALELTVATLAVRQEASGR